LILLVRQFESEVMNDEVSNESDDGGMVKLLVVPALREGEHGQGMGSQRLVVSW
jgi:hypothetical protein